jgi:integrase
MEGIQIPGLRAVTYKPKTTVPKIVSELNAHLEVLGRSHRHQETVQHQLKTFSTFYGDSIGQLSADKIREFVESMEVSPRTRNNYLDSIGRMITFAMSRRYLPRWWDELKQVDRYSEEPRPVKVYTVSDLENVLNGCYRTILPVTLLTAFAGVRVSEALRMDWSDVNIARRFVAVLKGKVGRARRLCPMSENLSKWLEWAGTKQIGPLYSGTRKTYHELLRRSLKKAAVKPIQNGLRHSFVSYRLALTQKVHEVALAAGNSEKVIFQSYREAVTKEQAEEYFRILPPAHEKQLSLNLAEPWARQQPLRQWSFPPQPVLPVPPPVAPPQPVRSTGP